MKLFLHNSNEQVSADCGPDLCFDGILRCSVKGLDPEVLLDPLEEQFYLPACLVDLRYCPGIDLEVVGEKHKRLSSPCIAKTNTPHSQRIFLGGIKGSQHDSLIAEDPRGSIHGMGIPAEKVESFLGSGHKERTRLLKPIKTTEIEVSPIHNVECSRHWNQHVQHVDVVAQSIGNMNKFRDVSMEIEQGVKFHGSLCSSEVCPREERKTQIDGCRVESVNCGIEIESQIFVGIKSSGFLNKDLCNVRKNPPVASLVGFGERTLRYPTVNADMIELGLQTSETGLDIPQTFSISQLSKYQTQQMISAREGSHSFVSIVSVDTGSKTTIRKEVHDLCEDYTTSMHARPPLVSKAGMLMDNSNRCRSLSFTNTQLLIRYNIISQN